ncbi:hypothetical protein EZ428_02765 [Pedobacter frigiditerrae]|uniref:Uncharacterized protein n=1 Tax=Pedobacter frigiditerrae TaxID=2530452 RepID=A0A4R0N1U8_9SPHI|nr:hypothetical protein [Pedobacter frigiditerrae]TCC93710.1 hypothetical protein EZ428_02765 [Pedobacter frigiditerrae]
MKNILITLLLCVASNICFSQSQASDAIKKSLVVDQKLFHSNEFEKKSFLFLLTLSIDSNGNVDSVSHSESDVFSKKLIDINKTIRRLKSDKSSFKEYKNQVLVIGINLMRSDAERTSLTDLNKLYTSLLKSTEKYKKITYLDSLLIVI